MLWCREWTREKCLQSKEIIDKMKVVSTNYSQLLRSYEILPCPKPPKTASGTEVVNGVVFFSSLCVTVQSYSSAIDRAIILLLPHKGKKPFTHIVMKQSARKTKRYTKLCIAR